MFYCAGHTVISATLRDKLICVDLGFNRGEFTGYLIDRYKVPVHAAEPVKALVDSAPKFPGLTLHNVAVGGEDGKTSMIVFSNRCASIYSANDGAREYSEEVDVWSMETFWSNLPEGEIGLVKVDIEGAEFGMFLNASASLLRRARQYTVEFHDFLWKERRADVARVIKELEDAGFVCLRFSKDNTNVVFIRRDWLPGGRLGRLWFIGPIKYSMGVYRTLVRNATRWKRRLA